MKIKQLLFTLVASLMVQGIVTTAMAQNNDIMSNNKTLVAYFSATGTTMEAATKLAKAANQETARPMSWL